MNSWGMVTFGVYIDWEVVGFPKWAKFIFFEVKSDIQEIFVHHAMFDFDVQLFFLKQFNNLLAQTFKFVSRSATYLYYRQAVITVKSKTFFVKQCLFTFSESAQHVQADQFTTLSPVETSHGTIKDPFLF